MNSSQLSQQALASSLKIIKQFEGLHLTAYPDPASELAIALINKGMWKTYLDGKFIMPKEWETLDGAPWTIGYGCTQGVKKGDVWTLEKAQEALSVEVARVGREVLKRCPKLATEAPSRIAACVSLAYNIGMGNFGKSTVAHEIEDGDMRLAADAILMWDKAQGKVLHGLQERRKVERNMFLAV